MAPPMPISRTGAARHPRAPRMPALVPLLVALVAVTACTPATPSPSPPLSGSPTASPTPKPTPRPTPLFSNTTDPALVALIPTEVAGRTVRVPAITEFGLTPGDIGQVYGEIGLRFTSLQLAFVPRPHQLSLYAVRMRPPFATTAELEPYLAEAGRYVGMAGPHREPWKLDGVSGHLVWWRPEDNATLKGTRVYTWAADGLVFLMIGVDEAQNLAMLAALPGEPGPSPTPAPSATGGPTGTPSGTPIGSSPGSTPLPAPS